MSKRASACLQKVQVEDIVKKLEDKHDHYSIEKLNAWAHLIHLGKHTS